MASVGVRYEPFRVRLRPAAWLAAALLCVPTGVAALPPAQSAIILPRIEAARAPVVVAGGAGVDLVAERAYLRTGFNNGAEVSTPSVGQSVVFHTDWRVDGSGGPFSVSIRAVLDGQTFCVLTGVVEGGDSLVTFCNGSWSASGGTHTVRWELDYTGAIAESNESNNTIARTWNSSAAANASALRAYLRSGANSGEQILVPLVGQTAFFHLDWTSTNLPSSVGVPVLAVLDGVPFCGGTLTPGAGESIWCSNGWTATAGSHTLHWQLDADDVIAEINEADNDAELFWTSGAPPSPTHTRTRTLTPSRTPTRTPTATRTPTVTRTPTLGSPTPTRTRSLDPGFHARGDTDCSITHSAADIVATVRALGGVLGCGNADCDRDGDIGTADVACSASCVFDECRVSDAAPGILEVRAESAQSIVPGSLFTVRATNLGGGERLVTATLAGVDAVVVALEGDLLTLVVPLLDSGSALLVLRAGELASAAVPVVIAAPSPIGQPDTLADLITLLDTVVLRFAAIDLSDLFAAEDLSLVVDALQRYRDELHAIDLDDPQLSAEVGAQLDAVVDTSGVPDLLREIIAELQASSAFGVSAGAGAAGATRALAQFGRAVRAGAGLTRVITPALGARTLATTLLRSALGGVVVSVAVNALASAVLEPPILALSFSDEHGQQRERPTAAGTVRVTTRGNVTAGIRLLATTAYGTFERVGTNCGTGCIDYRFPDALGFCGAVGFRLERLGVGSRQSLGTTIQPEIIDVDPTSAGFGDDISLYVRGVAPCSSRARFEGPLEGTARVRLSDLTLPVAEDHNRLRTVAGVPLHGQLRELPPGQHRFAVEVQEIASTEPFVLRLRTAITGMTLACAPTGLALAPASPTAATCAVHPLPQALAQFPVDTEFEWNSSDPIVADSSGLTLEPTTEVVSASPGNTDVTASAVAGGLLLASSSDAAHLTVEDRTAPLLDVFQLPELNIPGCGGTLTAGGTVLLLVRGDDNFSMGSLRVSGPAGTLLEPDQFVLCTPGMGTDPEVCLRTVALDFLSAAPAGQVVVRFEATDLGGNVTTSQCSYTVIARLPTPTPSLTSTVTRSPTPPPTPTSGPIGVRFLKIADRQTIVPRAAETFLTFGEFAVDNGNVAFEARYNSNSITGIYLHDGASLVALANEETVMTGETIGGQPRRFDSYSKLAFDDGVIVFSGGTRAQLFSKEATGFESMVQRFIILPVFLPHSYGFVQHASYSLGGVAFSLDDSPNGTPAIYFAGGPVQPEDLSNLVLIADGTTAIPGGTGTFTGFFSGSARRVVASDAAAGDVVAFIGSGANGQEGVYRARPGGAVELVANNAGGLSGFCAVAVDGADVAFVTAQGVYLRRQGGPMTVVADASTAIADLPAHRFDRFSCGVAFDRGVLAFAAEAAATGQQRYDALFVSIDGQLRKIVGTTDMLDGRTVSGAEIDDDQSIDSRSGADRVSDIATRLSVSGNEPAIYRVTLARDGS